MRHQTLCTLAFACGLVAMAAAQGALVPEPRPHTRAETLGLVTREVAAREKVEVDPSSPVHLVTVWGVGYRLTGE